MARRNPPTSPMTFSAGTCTSVSKSSPVSTPRTPILWSVRPTSTPSHARSTMKAVIESWARLAGSLVLAKTVYQSASTHARHPALGAVEHPAAVAARIGHPPGPHPHDVAARLGLGQPEAGPQRPVTDAGQVPLLLLLGAGDHDAAPWAAGSTGASAPPCWSTWPPPRWPPPGRGCRRRSPRTLPGRTDPAGRRRGTPRRCRLG